MTLRERIEAIRDRTEPYSGQHPLDACTHSDAVAALAILDEAHVRPARPPFTTPHRLVPDPERPAATPTTTEAS